MTMMALRFIRQAPSFRNKRKTRNTSLCSSFLYEHLLIDNLRCQYHRTCLRKHQQQEIKEEETSPTRPTHQIRNKYLHIGPSGDSWISYSIFAAKHLQPDYVKSLPLFLQEGDGTPNDGSTITGKYYELLLEIFRQEEQLIEILEEDVELSLKLYDSGSFSMDLVQELHQRIIDEL